MTTSLRNFPEQFGKGITIDGTRIGANIESLVNKLNNVAPNLLSRRWVPTYWVAGHTTPDVANPSFLPWMSQNNDQVKSAIEVPAIIYSPHRNKNYTIEGSSEVYSWEDTIYCTRPTILSSLCVWCLTDSVYTNTFKYGASPPPNPETGGNFNTGDYIKDLTIQVTVDSFLDPEDRTKTAVEAVQYRFDVSRSFISFGAINPALDTLLPASPAGPVGTGLCVEIPVACLIPENSRIRIEVLIPYYDDPTVSGWQMFPQQNGVWSMNATLLEALEV